MKIAKSVEQIRLELSKKGNTTRVFVPTMGNLHEGHLSLIRTAHEHGGFVIVSIFVNRLQFEPHGDFDEYPRTLRDDIKKLEEENVHLLFVPEEHDLYPEEQEFRVIPSPELSQILEGETRPNFFVGVCTVLMKLFSIVQPNLAILSKKDYQQLLIVQRMCFQFNMPIEIVPHETVRDQDGLALSSRNGFLTQDERKEAPFLYQTLLSLATEIKENPNPDFSSLEARAMNSLARRGWKPFYVAIRERKRLRNPSSDGKSTLVILAAAQLGTVRLIDNIEI